MKSTPLILLTAVLTGPWLCPGQETVVPQSAFGSGQGVNGTVEALAVQADGKIILVGEFSAVNGVPRGNLARLNSDGTLDRTFADSPTAGVSGSLKAVAIRPDGGIVVGGSFSQAGEVGTNNVALYSQDGVVDPSFASEGYPGANGPVLAIAALADGSVLLGGSFTEVCGQQRVSLAKIHADGSLAAAFPASGRLDGPVLAIAGTTEFHVAGGTFRPRDQAAKSLTKIPELSE